MQPSGLSERQQLLQAIEASKNPELQGPGAGSDGTGTPAPNPQGAEMPRSATPPGVPPPEEGPVAAASAEQAPAEQAPAHGGDEQEAEQRQEQEQEEEEVYCLCRKPWNGELMVECESCEKWYHPQCVGLALPANSEIASWGHSWRCAACRGPAPAAAAVPAVPPRVRGPGSELLNEDFAAWARASKGVWGQVRARRREIRRSAAVPAAEPAAEPPVQAPAPLQAPAAEPIADEWVQCEEADCGKWRRLPPTVSLADIGEGRFVCSMAHWLHQPCCDIPEDVEEEEPDWDWDEPDPYAKQYSGKKRKQIDGDWSAGPAKKKAPAKRRAFRSGKGPPKMKEENCKIWFRYAVERQTIFQYAPAPAHTSASFAPWART